MRVLLDANCLVAAALPQHEHHPATIADLSRRRSSGDVFLMAAPALVEAYAVLTRLPAPHRLAPADALMVIDRNWGAVETIAITAAETWRLLRRLGADGVTGGRAYDAAIADCARKGKADEIVTWNVRHFNVAGDVRVVTPARDR